MTTTKPETERWRQAVDDCRRRREAERQLRAELDAARRYAKDRHHTERLRRAARRGR